MHHTSCMAWYASHHIVYALVAALIRASLSMHLYDEVEEIPSVHCIRKTFVKHSAPIRTFVAVSLSLFVFLFFFLCSTHATRFRLPECRFWIRKKGTAYIFLWLQFMCDPLFLFDCCFCSALRLAFEYVLQQMHLCRYWVNVSKVGQWTSSSNNNNKTTPWTYAKTNEIVSTMYRNRKFVSRLPFFVSMLLLLFGLLCGKNIEIKVHKNFLAHRLFANSHALVLPFVPLAHCAICPLCFLPNHPLFIRSPCAVRR